MGQGFKTIFRMVRGRLIPIRVSIKPNIPDELQKIEHVKAARKFMRENIPDDISAVFWKTAKKESKVVGRKVAKRMSQMSGKNLLKLLKGLKYNG